MSLEFSLLILDNHVCCWHLVYKDVPGYEGIYSVGIYGTIWSRWVSLGVGKYIIGDDGDWHQLVASPDSSGHPQLHLFKNGVSTTFRVHQLVAQAFIGPCPPGLECCHNDGNPSNNNLCNLRYDTHENNMADRIKHGTMQDQRGERNPNSYITQEIADLIRAEYAAGATQTVIAAKHRITQPHVSYIVRDKAWVLLKEESEIRP